MADEKAKLLAVIEAALKKAEELGIEVLEDIERFVELIWEELEKAGLAIVHAVEAAVEDVEQAL